MFWTNLLRSVAGIPSIRIYGLCAPKPSVKHISNNLEPVLLEGSKTIGNILSSDLISSDITLPTFGNPVKRFSDYSANSIYRMISSFLQIMVTPPIEN